MRHVQEHRFARFARLGQITLVALAASLAGCAAAGDPGSSSGAGDPASADDGSGSAAFGAPTGEATSRHGAVAAYGVGGSVSGLLGRGLVLTINGTQDLALESDGAFRFPARIADGTAYSVAVKSDPIIPSQRCDIASSDGTIAGAGVSDLRVVCTTKTFAIGGTVTGLHGKSVVLVMNDDDELSVDTDGLFHFEQPIEDGAQFAVRVKAQPPGQTCTIARGVGTPAGANVMDVAVSCGPHGG